MTSTASPVADRADLLRTLGVLTERPSPGVAALAETLGLDAPSPVEHTELFLQQLPPYASIYLDPTGKIGGGARDRVAGFWRAMSMTPPAEPDHLAALLGLWATIIEATVEEPGPERRGLLKHSARTLVWEHLSSWLIPYLRRFRELSTGPYGDWADLLAAVLEEPLEGPSPILPMHLREKREQLSNDNDLIAYLLTPIRSGIIITRADLGRAAADLRLGMRLGERAFSLASLLDQAHRSILAWLAVEADRQAAMYQSVRVGAVITEEWASRALDTSETLRRRIQCSGSDS
ncbi:MAG TPA: molecular chaperone TorD family protein [Acidimicrobiia bacterium]|nr:molecular chaperone TorD family protein [Acidimicrobiia bacterium]